MKLEELLDKVDTLLSLPDVFVRVNDLIDDPKSSAGDIAEVIAHDPALTARLLKVVNSAYYGLSAPVDTVAKAVTVLGMEDLHALIMATTTVEAFQRIPSDLMDMDSFWHRSVFCALAARELAGRMAAKNRERFFVTGLLHDVGKLVLFHQLPEVASGILARFKAGVRPLHELELESLGFTHPQIGAELMRRWRFPATLWEPVEYQYAPAGALQHGLEAALLHIAVGVTNSVEPELKKDASTYQAVVVTDPRAWEITGLSEDDAESVVGPANMNCISVLEVINPSATMTF